MCRDLWITKPNALLCSKSMLEFFQLFTAERQDQVQHVCSRLGWSYRQRWELINDLVDLFCSLKQSRHLCQPFIKLHCRRHHIRCSTNDLFRTEIMLTVNEPLWQICGFWNCPAILIVCQCSKTNQFQRNISFWRITNIFIHVELVMRL